MAVAVFLLALGAVLRVTRFVNDDELFQPVRDWVDRRYGPESKLAYLLTCPWCASIYVAAPAAVVSAGWIAPAIGAPWWFAALTLWLTYSFLSGLILGRLS